MTGPKPKQKAKRGRKGQRRQPTRPPRPPDLPKAEVERREREEEELNPGSILGSTEPVAPVEQLPACHRFLQDNVAVTNALVFLAFLAGLGLSIFRQTREVGVPMLTAGLGYVFGGTR